MKIGKLIFGLSASIFIVLGGCSSTTKISDENAIEVAIDEANTKEEDVKNLSCDNSEDGFTVSFDLNGLQYVYKISNVGIIESSRTKHLTNIDKITKLDPSNNEDEKTNNKGQASEESENNEKDENSQQEDEDSKGADNNPAENESIDEEKNKVAESDTVLIALDYLGITEEDASKIKIDVNDDNNCQVSFKYDDYNCSFLIDSENGDILSAIVQ